MKWPEFTAAVIEGLTVDGPRQGTKNYRDRVIRSAAIDLQTYVKGYRRAQQQLYGSNDLLSYGTAQTGSLPDGANVIAFRRIGTVDKDAYVSDFSEDADGWVPTDVGSGDTGTIVANKDLVAGRYNTLQFYPNADDSLHGLICPKVMDITKFYRVTGYFYIPEQAGTVLGGAFARVPSWNNPGELYTVGKWTKLEFPRVGALFSDPGQLVIEAVENPSTPGFVGANDPLVDAIYLHDIRITEAPGDEDLAQNRLSAWPWERRFDLTRGEDCIVLPSDVRGYYSIDSMGDAFYIYPALKPGESLVVEWNGKKTSFGDSEELAWGEEAIQPAINFVKAHFAREVDKDLPLYQSYMADYVRGRTRLFSEDRDNRKTGD